MNASENEELSEDTCTLNQRQVNFEGGSPLTSATTPTTVMSSEELGSEGKCPECLLIFRLIYT